MCESSNRGRWDLADFPQSPLENLSALQRASRTLRRDFYLPAKASIMRPIILHRRIQDKKAAIPPPLPERPRKLRHLSRPRTGKPGSQGGALFAKLPYEIRRMIYIYVLGDEIIHLDHPSDKPRIVHNRCEWNLDGGYHSHRPYGPVKNDARVDKLSLLKTC